MEEKEDISPSKRARFDDNIAYIEADRLKEVRANGIIGFHFHGFESSNIINQQTTYYPLFTHQIFDDETITFRIIKNHTHNISDIEKTKDNVDVIDTKDENSNKSKLELNLNDPSFHIHLDTRNGLYLKSPVISQGFESNSSSKSYCYSSLDRESVIEQINQFHPPTSSSIHSSPHSSSSLNMNEPVWRGHQWQLISTFSMEIDNNYNNNNKNTNNSNTHGTSICGDRDNNSCKEDSRV